MKRYEVRESYYRRPMHKAYEIVEVCTCCGSKESMIFFENSKLANEICDYLNKNPLQFDYKPDSI